MMEQVEIPRILNKSGTPREFGVMLSQHEALRRATLLKHRKVSTQLKLDMVQRQLSGLRRTSPDSDNDREFYRLQMTELSNELHDLGSTLDRVERNAFYAKRRVMKQNGIDNIFSNSEGAIPLSSSHPAIYSSSENLSRSGSRSSLKARVCHLMSSPNLKLKKKHLWGELRSVASLSSLNIKSSSPNSEEEGAKDSKPWKAPLRFLGKMVDARIRRKFWISGKRTKSVDNIADDVVVIDRPSATKSSTLTDFENLHSFDSPEVRCHIDSSSSSSSSSESSDDEVEEDWKAKPTPKYTWKAPVMRRISNNNHHNNNNNSNNTNNNNVSNQKVQIDPAILAEIEDFEKMAAQYIKQHS